MPFSPIPSSESIVRPPLILLLGPAGAGKTQRTLSRFTSSRGRGLLLVSSTEQADTRAAQAAARVGLPPAEVRSSIFTFRTLTTELLRGADQESGRTIGRAFQRLILTEVVKRTVRPEDYFGAMLRAPGFVAALTERIRDWKLACITPDQLAAVAQPAAEHLQDPSFARKAAEMARLYHAYEQFLTRNHLRDEEDLLRMATARVASGLDPLPGNADCVLVDGFYRFNPAQRRLLSALANRGMEPGAHLENNANTKPEVELVVTLPYEATRPLLFAAPAHTLTTLRAEFVCQEEILVPETSALSPALTTLSQSLFAPVPPLPTPHSQLPTPHSPVLLFDSPNPYAEAEMVAGEFRRLYDAGGYLWSDFVVILRAMGDYAPILAAVFERYGIPIGVDGPEALSENPLVKTVLHLLAVIRQGWQREDVLAFLKSSYTTPSRLDADLLRRRARAAGVREGRERWLALVEAKSTASIQAESIQAESIQAESIQAESIQAESNYTAVTASFGPPDSVVGPLREMARYDVLLTAGRAEAGEYADLIRELITVFGIEERIAPGEPTRRERDRAALQTAQEVLYALTQMFALSGRGPVTFSQFHDELTAAWRGASSLGAPTGETVHVAEPYDARERNVKVAAVMGLTERVFPRRISEDPFLRDEERAALRLLAHMDLEEQRGRADDERFLFYLAATAPSERLILSYPRASDESDTLPSFFLDEVRAALDAGQLQTVARTLADVTPRPEEAVSGRDRLLAACADLFDPNVPAPAREACVQRAAARMQDCLHADPETVRDVLRSRSLPRLPRLVAPELRRRFAAHRNTYRVSELESYGRCPLQYLLGHVMGLHPEEDVTQGQTQGALLHGVLHRYFRRRAARRHLANESYNETYGESHGDIHGDMKRDSQESDGTDVAAVRMELNRLLEEALAQARLDASPHQLRMTHRLLADALDGFAERDARFTTQFGMTPTQFALTFGMGHGAAEGWDEGGREQGEGTLNGQKQRNDSPDGPVISEREGEDTEQDPASCPEPLLLQPMDGGPPVAVCGTIDRVDLDASRQRALVLDYMLGRPPEYAEIQRGTSLQMPLHLLAMERLFGRVGAVACYDSPRERGRRRMQRMEHVNIRQFAPILPLEDGTMVTPLNREQYAGLVKTAEGTAIRLARAIQTAEVPATPGDHCRQCAFSDICRTTLINGHDGEQPEGIQG
jgi:ATP-dependent helicase/nuclease subunit B